MCLEPGKAFIRETHLQVYKLPQRHQKTESYAQTKKSSNTLSKLLLAKAEPSSKKLWEPWILAKWFSHISYTKDLKI